MEIVAAENNTYLLLNGISVSRNIAIGREVELQPADTSHLDFNTAISACAGADDIAVVQRSFQKLPRSLRSQVRRRNMLQSARGTLLGMRYCSVPFFTPR